MTTGARPRYLDLMVDRRVDGRAVRATAIAARAVGSARVCGSPAAAIRAIVSELVITMKRHGCEFRLLPDQRAASVIACRASALTGSEVNSRIWRTRRRGRTRSEAGTGESAMEFRLARAFER